MIPILENFLALTKIFLYLYINSEIHLVSLFKVCKVPFCVLKNGVQSKLYQFYCVYVYRGYHPWHQTLGYLIIQLSLGPKISVNI